MEGTQAHGIDIVPWSCVRMLMNRGLESGVVGLNHRQDLPARHTKPTTSASESWQINPHLISCLAFYQSSRFQLYTHNNAYSVDEDAQAVSSRFCLIAYIAYPVLFSVSICPTLEILQKIVFTLVRTANVISRLHQPRPCLCRPRSCGQASKASRWSRYGGWHAPPSNEYRQISSRLLRQSRHAILPQVEEPVLETRHQSR